MIIDAYLTEVLATPLPNIIESTNFIELLATHNLNEQAVNFKAYKQLLVLTRYACNQEQKGLSHADEETMRWAN